MSADLLQSTIFMVKKKKADLAALIGTPLRDFAPDPNGTRYGSSVANNLELIRKDKGPMKRFQETGRYRSSSGQVDTNLNRSLGHEQREQNTKKNSKASIFNTTLTGNSRVTEDRNIFSRAMLPQIGKPKNELSLSNNSQKKSKINKELPKMSKSLEPKEARNYTPGIEELIEYEYKQKFQEEEQFIFPRNKPCDGGSSKQSTQNNLNLHNTTSVEALRMAQMLKTNSVAMTPDVTVSLLQSVNQSKSRNWQNQPEPILWKAVLSTVDFSTVKTEGHLANIFEEGLRSTRLQLSPRSSNINLQYLHGFSQAVMEQLSKTDSKRQWLRVNAVLASFLASRFSSNLDETQNSCFSDLMNCLVSVQKSLIFSTCKECKKINQTDHKEVLAAGEGLTPKKKEEGRVIGNLEGDVQDLQEKLVHTKAEWKMEQYSNQVTEANLLEQIRGLQDKIRLARVSMVNLDRTNKNLEEQLDISKELQAAQKKKILRMEKFIIRKFKDGKKKVEALEDKSDNSKDEQQKDEIFKYTEGTLLNYLQRKRELSNPGETQVYEHVAAKHRKLTLLKSHSQRKLNKKAVEQIKFYKLDTKSVSTFTDDLISYEDSGCQTKISMVMKRYDTLITCQYDLDLLRQRSNFETEVMSGVGKSNYACFIKDDLIRSLMHLKPYRDPESLPAQKLDLINEFSEHSKDFSCEPEQDPEGVSKFFSEPFDLNKLDLYVNHRLQVPVEPTPSIFKYIFYSYIFSAHSLKKKCDLIIKKEDELDTLFKLIKLYKERIITLVKDKRALIIQLDTLKKAHKDCKTTAILQEFQFSLEPSKELNTGNDMDSQFVPKQEQGISSASFVESSVELIMQKVSEVQNTMQPKAKKTSSFKSVYNKIHQFMQARCQEVKFDDKLKVIHSLPFSYHFYKLLVEKETTSTRVEERIRNFIVTVMNTNENSKISIFKRLTKLELLSEENAAMQEYLYFRAMSQIKSECRGLEIAPDLLKGLNLVPYDKFDSFLQKHVYPTLCQFSKDCLLGDLKQLCDLVAPMSDSTIFKKGTIDFDSAINAVFRYTNTCEDEYRMQQEACFSTFLCLDIKCTKLIPWYTFLRMYQLITMDNHNETIKLLLKSTRENEGQMIQSLKSELTEENFSENLEISCTFSPLATESKQDKEVPVLSEEELWRIFKRYAQNENQQQACLNYQKFFSMLQEFGNRLFTVEKVCKYLKVDIERIELEYYHVKKSFDEFYEPYRTFLMNSYIMPSSKQKYLHEKLTLVSNLFINDKFKDDIVKDARRLLLDNRIMIDDDEREIQICIMLRTLLANRELLLDLMEADFDQRLEYVPDRETLTQLREPTTSL